MLKSFIIAVPFLTWSLAVHAGALPGDAAAGKKLAEANCTACHDNSVYQRKDRKIHSLGALKQQINSCGHATGVQLGQAQMNDLVKYLNENFYKFK